MKTTSLMYIKENPIKASIIIILAFPIIVIILALKLLAIIVLGGLMQVGKAYNEKNESVKHVSGVRLTIKKDNVK